MFFICECNAQVFLNTNKSEKELPLNLVCTECFKSKTASLYLIEYEIPPLRAILHEKIFAASKEKAIEILTTLKSLSGIHIRSVKEL